MFQFCKFPNECLPWEKKLSLTKEEHLDFHGSLIQSGLDLKALNRNKPGVQRNSLDLVTAFLMLTF